MVVNARQTTSFKMTTPLQEHRFETTKLLLQYGADPFLESRYKDDALQTACLKGAAEIFEYLVDHIPFSPERVASAFELLGSTFLDEHHDSQKTQQYWRAACDIRDKFGLTKTVLQPKTQYRFLREFLTCAELDALSSDVDVMRIQSLLICERILGTLHKDMIYRLMYRGAAVSEICHHIMKTFLINDDFSQYADSLQYQCCIDLWKYALELRVAKDSILFCDTCFTAQALVKLYLDLHEKHSLGVVNTEVRLEDVMSTIELLSKDLNGCAQLLTVAPQFRRQQDSHDKVLRIITHLMHLATRLAPRQASPAADMEMRRRIHHILHRVNPRTTGGDSLLHLSVMKNNTLKSQLEDGQYAFFPSLEVAKLLVECGADANATNATADTPLHTASAVINYRPEVFSHTLGPTGANI